MVLQKSRERFVLLQELNPNGGILEVQSNYAYLLHLQGHLEAAICTYKDALKLAEQGTLFLDICIDKHAHKKHISEFHANFGWALAMAGQYDDALDNLKRSYRSLKSGSNTSQKVNALIKHYQQRSPSIKRI